MNERMNTCMCNGGHIRRCMIIIMIWINVCSKLEILCIVCVCVCAHVLEQREDMK